ASSTYATADDVRGLRKEMREGFDRVEGAIKAGQAQTSTTISKTPTTTTMAVPTTTIPGAIERHIRYTERRAASDKPESPYALQVVIRTDVNTQPTALQIKFDGPVSSGDVFVTGQAVTMNVMTGFSEDRTLFALSFAFPAWTPVTPIV